MRDDVHSWDRAPFGAVDELRLTAFESSYESELPEEFRDWLQQVNGGKPKRLWVDVPQIGFVKIHHVYGLHNGPDYLQIDSVNEIVSGNLNGGLVAFAEDEGGNQFSVSLRVTNFGSVVFWDHETGDEYLLERSIWGFDSLLVDDVAKPSITNLEHVEDILRADDVEGLEQVLKDNDADLKNEVNRTMLEEAAIFGSVKCIKRLHEKGAKPFNAIQLARNNMEFFPEHRETVELLENLYS